MEKARALELFGGVRNLARITGYPPSRVHSWSEVLPVVTAERAIRKAIRAFLKADGPRHRAMVLDLFGGASSAARACGISHQAVYKWGDELPFSAQTRVREALDNFLRDSGRPR